MIISRGRKYIFVHAPKTGGTSLALALEARAMKDDILIGDTPKAKKRRGRIKGLKSAGRLWKHATLADIDGVVGLEELDDFLVFTLVRNPWDRMVSYYHWLQGQRFDHPAVAFARQLSFEHFVMQPMVQASFKESPARAYVTDAGGTERPAAFIRLEQLSLDLAPVEAHLGFKLGEIPRINASDRGEDYRSAYSDQTREAVARCCAEDIVRFGYVF
jgi:hypothetical protein